MSDAPVLLNNYSWLFPAAARRRLLRRPPPPSPPRLSPSHRIVGAYLVSPAHRIVGDQEEEAVNSYTEFLRDLENANVENVPAPTIAIDYWRLPPESSSKESSKRLYSSACGIDILMDSRIFRKFSRFDFFFSIDLIF
ncbi:ubiquinol oxidase (non-electrogenic) [Sarracenia purpurea var. burkii]